MTEDTVDADAAADGGADADDADEGGQTEADTEAAGVDAGTVEHVAGLARVNLDDGERERFAEQFGDIIEYFETLDEVPEVERAPELTNVMRPDEIAASLDREAALENASDTEDGQFKGPRVS